MGTLLQEKKNGKYNNSYRIFTNKAKIERNGSTGDMCIISEILVCLT